jgi:hypothetical protein
MAEVVKRIVRTKKIEVGPVSGGDPSIVVHYVVDSKFADGMGQVIFIVFYF